MQKLLFGNWEAFVEAYLFRVVVKLFWEMFGLGGGRRERRRVKMRMKM